MSFRPIVPSERQIRRDVVGLQARAFADRAEAAAQIASQRREVDWNE